MNANRDAVVELCTYVLQHGTVTQRSRTLAVFLLKQAGMTDEKIAEIAMGRSAPRTTTKKKD